MTRASSLILKAIIIVVALAMPWRADAVAPLAGEGVGRGVPTVAPLLAKVTPAVVNILVVSERPIQSNQLYTDPFLRRFFDLPDQPPRSPQTRHGSGGLVHNPKAEMNH